MKYSVLLFLFYCNFIPLAAQNLIPNPSFEDAITCPVGVDELYKAQFWMSFRESPEYFHGCDNNINGIVGVPNNFISYQNAHSGNAYAGFIPYDLTGAPYREYLAVKLIQNTEANQKYFVSFYVSFAGVSGFTIAVNNLGIALTNTLHAPTYPYPISNNPAVYDDSIYTDSIGWSKISMSFTADSAYQYLVIGNFFDDQHTDTALLGEFNIHSYYLLDDVCLSKHEESCFALSGMATSNSVLHPTIFPNPARNAFYIDVSETTTQVKVYDLFGRVIFCFKEFRVGPLNIDCSRWPEGAYIIEIDGTFQKILVTN
ncbi:MAG: T9SS type A sorting domain-containing protein [Chitinophagales bacterium]